jgi:hypothetical protein
MNYKDKEAFVKYMGENLPYSYYVSYHCPELNTWQAACEYKEAENKKLREALKLSLKTNLELWEMPDVVHLDDHGEAINLAIEALKGVDQA